MGFDIYGKAPRSKAGRYFGANWGAWEQIARLCLRVAPGSCSQIDEKYWFSNDGFGLNDAGAIALADALDHAINTDAIRYEDALSGQQSAQDRDALLGAVLPDGRQLAFVAPDIIPSGNPWLITRLRDLIAFLRDSGGFEIW
jgi:hypothetical protein